MKETFTKKLGQLNQAILQSVSASDEKEISKTFTDVIISILKASYGFCFLKNQGKNQFELAYKDPDTPFEPPLPRLTGATQEVFKQKFPLFIKNYIKSPWAIKMLDSYKIKGFVSIPINYQSNTYGTFNICYQRLHKFTKEEKDLCLFIGNSAAQAITINRLYKNLARAKSNLEKRVKERTSELEQSKTVLEIERAKDNAILSGIGEGIIATDAGGKIILANPPAAAILGSKEKDLLKMSLLKDFPLLDGTLKEIQTSSRPIFGAIHKSRRLKTDQAYYRKKDGTLVPVAVTAAPIVLKDKVTGAVQVFRDVTKEKEVDRVKSELISLASHQLRTPLSAINWYAEALLSGELGKLGADQKRYLNEIFQANQKMVELVYDFLNVSRIELGTFSIKLSTINLKELAESILGEIKPLISQKKLAVTKNYGRGLEKLEADRKIVRLILQNLLTNAVKYTPAGGKISLAVNVEKKAAARKIISIVIADTGFGIPRHQQSKVFTKLFRGDNAAKLDTGGSGLGLYLVKSFVDFCGGKIWFKSTPGKGSTFYVKLPLPKAAAVGKTAP